MCAEKIYPANLKIGCIYSAVWKNKWFIIIKTFASWWECSETYELQSKHDVFCKKPWDSYELFWRKQRTAVET